MAKSTLARELLREARAFYDDPGTGLSHAAVGAWQFGFASGAEWMRLALGCLRGVPPAGPSCRFNLLGAVKYGLASAGAFACLAAAYWWEQPLLVLMVVPIFYAIEAQLVFLFPLVLDETPAPFRAARIWTMRAGGTLTVMRTVLPLAATMLFGGFAGQGFVRSWCLGCLAVCLWYERIRIEAMVVIEEPKTS